MSFGPVLGGLSATLRKPVLCGFRNVARCGGMVEEMGRVVAVSVLSGALSPCLAGSSIRLHGEFRQPALRPAPEATESRVREQATCTFSKLTAQSGVGLAAFQKNSYARVGKQGTGRTQGGAARVSAAGAAGMTEEDLAYMRELAVRMAEMVLN